MLLSSSPHGGRQRGRYSATGGITMQKIAMSLAIAVGLFGAGVVIGAENRENKEERLVHGRPMMAYDRDAFCQSRSQRARLF